MGLMAQREEYAKQHGGEYGPIEKIVPWVKNNPTANALVNYNPANKD